MKWHGWERPHKAKGYKVWTYQDWLDVSNKHKFDTSVMTMMRMLVRGINSRKGWLKERKDFMKISQEPTLPNLWSAA